MPDNPKMLLNLFGGMQDALFLGDPLAREEFVSFLQPGQFISTNLIESGASDDMAIQSEIANILIDTSFINKYADTTFASSKELPGSVNQVYSDIMNNAALPFEEMTAAVLAEIASLQQWIAGNKPNYDLYKGRYYDALEAYNTQAHSQNPDGAKLQRLQQNVTDARKDWLTFGLQGVYDRKTSRLIYLTAPDPTSFWQELKDRMDNQFQRSPNRGGYYQTFFFPSIASWGSAGWSTFEKRISETDTYDYSKSTSWSGGVSAGWGLWSFGGGASGSKSFAQSTSDVSNVSIKFDYLRVRVERPWLTEDVFGYKFWTWKKNFGKTYVSDGGNLKVTPPIRPVGRMPILVNYLILARNVELIANFSHNDVQTYNSQIATHASGGWGPFSVNGSYQESTGTKTTSSSFDGVTLRIPQPQIIARSGMLLDKTPDPDPTLSWQDDAWLPQSEPDETIAKIRQADYDRTRVEEKLMEAQTEVDIVARKMFDQKATAIRRG